MSPSRLPLPSAGDVAVIGLGRSGFAASELLRARGYAVYACDDATSSQLTDTAAELTALGVTAQTGGHDVGRLARASLVVVSPGVPPDAAALVAARNASREVVSEIEIALRCAPELRYVAVTGTNGKTTTTALIGHIFRALGLNAPDAGNIGTPLSAVVNEATKPDWVALELSSFQLHDTPSVAPDVGVLTNLSADHLDRYGSVDEYFADKALLFRNATAASRWVLNADDPASLEITRDVAGAHFCFSLQGERDAWYQRAQDCLVVFDHALLPRSELQLLGDHNVANALAASLAVVAAADEFRTPTARHTIAQALRSFRAMPNRLEIVGEWHGVEWINDSKATNVASTLVAVQGMTRPTVLLLGGRHKGEPYTALARPIKQHVKHVIAFGEAGPIVEHDLANAAPLTRIDGSFEEVIAAARGRASTGDAVLLSPACSSYDMFNNYVARGERFRALAAEHDE
ncbi:MAG TPA: UDP-N-acetylmuramoyl-L-alanine--D-glutamate ligase [Gemmatimonadaceae bacterium]